MSEKSLFELHHAASSPLARQHPAARRVSTPGNQARQAPTLVFGFAPGLRRPTLSLFTHEHLGNVRHALTQRVVAGLMEVKVVTITRTVERAAEPAEVEEAREKRNPR